MGCANLFCKNRPLFGLETTDTSNIWQLRLDCTTLPSNWEFMLSLIKTKRNGEYRNIHNHTRIKNVMIKYIK
jgi:hypothetical protein